MPKQLINLIGVLVSVAVLALGIFLIAVPLATQALGTLSQAAGVERTNQLYEAQLAALTKAQENKAQTDKEVAALRAQIPAVPQLDDVFALVATSAQSSGLSITSVTAGTPAAFVARTSATKPGEQPPTPAPKPSPTATAGGPVGQAQQVASQADAQAAQTNAASGATASSGTPASTSTRSQIDFAITVSGSNIDQVTAFLDALRGGPRLLSSITAKVTQSGTGVQASITALTFVDGAPISTGGTK